MMRVGWLADDAGYVGGAEMTQAEFRKACPTGVEIVDCPPGQIDPDCQVYAIHNSITYTLEDLAAIKGKRVVRYWNDVGLWYAREHRAWMDKHAIPVCCSRLQAEHMGLKDARLIPPPVDLQPFRDAAARVNGARAGFVSMASWRNTSKAPDAAMEWAAKYGQPIDFYGGGECKPPRSREIPYQGVPALLCRYRTFVFLPRLLEPFGRLVAEAWASGCELVVNGNVGAMEWLPPRGDPTAIERATIDYWQVLIDA